MENLMQELSDMRVKAFNEYIDTLYEKEEGGMSLQEAKDDADVRVARAKAEMMDKVFSLVNEKTMEFENSISRMLRWDSRLSEKRAKGEVE